MLPKWTGEGLVLFPALTAVRWAGWWCCEQSVSFHFCHIKQWHYSNRARGEGRAVFSFKAQNSLPCFVEKSFFFLLLSSIFQSWLMVLWRCLRISEAVCHLQLDTGYFKSLIHYKGQNRQFCVRASAWMENKRHVLIAPAGEFSRGLPYFPRLFSVPRFQNNTFFLAFHIMGKGLALY